MLNIVKSILNSSDDARASVITLIYEDLSKDLNPQELSVFKYLYDSWITYSKFPTEEIFLNKFPEYKASLSESQFLSQDSLEYYKSEFIEKHKRITASKKLLLMAQSVVESGLKPENIESLRDLATVNIEDNVLLQNSNVIDLYEDAKKKGSNGIKTYIPEIDQIIGAIEPGTVSVIAGYSGHGKSSWAVNMAYKAAKEGRNIVYISLEIPERDLLYDLISLHSTDLKFGIEPIPHSSIRKRTLDKKQEHNFKIVADDFNKNILPNLHILTERNFKEFSYGEVRDILYKVDAKKQIDCLFVDHANLLKFYASAKYSNPYEGVNDFVSFFRKMAICFKIEEGVDRQLAVILLAQCNRTGWIKAANAGKKDPTMEGRYDTTALSESNELERASSYTMFVYSSESMRLSKEARVSLVKSRFGQTHEDPISVNFIPEFYQFGEMSDITQSSTSDYSSASSFDSFLDINPTDIGFNLSSVDLSDL